SLSHPFENVLVGIDVSLECNVRSQCSRCTLKRFFQGFFCHVPSESSGSRKARLLSCDLRPERTEPSWLGTSHSQTADDACGYSLGSCSGKGGLVGKPYPS